MSREIIQSRSKKGFTLLESLVAITILILAVTAPLYSAGKSLAAARNSANQLTAMFLAQEGIEYVRYLRDTAVLYEMLVNGSTNGWSNFISKPVGTQPYTTLTQCRSVLSSADKRCSLSALPMPTISASNGVTTCPNTFLTITTNGVTSSTIFKRCFWAEYSSLSAQEIRVFSEVDWSYKGSNYSVKLVDHLTQWQ